MLYYRIYVINGKKKKHYTIDIFPTVSCAGKVGTMHAFMSAILSIKRKKERKPIKILDLLVCSDTGSGENNYSLGRESKAKSSSG
jgi:hypothetical protein